MSGKIQIPTNTMEQEFANYERRGYQKGLAVNAAHITELVANLQTQRREYLALEAQLADANQAARWESDIASQALADLAPYRKDAERYQWQPIETAPKDIPVLVFHNRMVIEAWYSTPWDKFVVSETGGSNLINPTHWMPLPTAPAIAEEKA